MPRRKKPKLRDQDALINTVSRLVTLIHHKASPDDLMEAANEARSVALFIDADGFRDGRVENRVSQYMRAIARAQAV